MPVTPYIRGIIEPDETFRKKFNAFQACKEAGIKIPEELWDYFDGDQPDPSGIVVPIEASCDKGDWSHRILEVDLTTLRKDVSKIQFVISY